MPISLSILPTKLSMTMGTLYFEGGYFPAIMHQYTQCILCNSTKNLRNLIEVGKSLIYEVKSNFMKLVRILTEQRKSSMLKTQRNIEKIVTE